ncbi:sensor histidine kinase [Nonomuraea sp. 3N208]|uniref:sensor histidine kinase n=1 Tax=Nonomuraea sp. 3N208 TaxID=3457421 RepID=UPI003FCEE510
MSVSRDPPAALARAIGYALLSLPMAAAGLVYVVVLLMSALWTALVIGAPLLAVGLLGARGLAAVERRLARVLLRMEVAAPPPFRPRPGLMGWIGSALGDAAAWRAVVYLLVKPPAAILACVAPLLLAPRAVRAALAPERLLVRRLLGQTETSARIRELEATRAQAVEDAAAIVRRIERDLHDGTQARLVALAMSLSMVKEELAEAGHGERLGRARDLVDVAHGNAKQALAELRDLVTGIHPAALDQGLEPALATLAAGSALPVDLHVDLPGRPSPAVETIAYFCAAELLTNAARHSGARRAGIELKERDRRLRLRVRDDGAGGAAMGLGTGLRGLADRVRVVDGTLEIHSPPGGPTVVSVDLPAHT